MDAKLEIISLSIRRLQSNFKKKVEHAYTYRESILGEVLNWPLRLEAGHSQIV